MPCRTIARELRGSWFPREEIMAEIEARRPLAVGEFLELVRVGHWEYARRTNSPGAVVIVPVTDDGRLVLIEQFRIPVDARRH